MADALVHEAPSKEKKVSKSKEDLVLSQEFDHGKKYMFELATPNPEREIPVVGMQGTRTFPVPHKRFKPLQNLVLTSQIVWKGSRRMIRYYDGCTSIFVDEQPKEKELIDQLIAQTSKDKYKFVDGKFGVYGDEKMILIYCNICSWNVDSPFRTRSADGIFRAINRDIESTIEASKLDQTEQALELAKKATATKMMIHANYLGIPVIDSDSGNELTEQEIRTEYRKEALRNSAKFIESYGNKSLEIKYYIDQALLKGVISNKDNPNKATWGSNSSVICDISGLRSSEAIATRLFEFSQSEEGQEFVIQLKAISE